VDGPPIELMHPISKELFLDIAAAVQSAGYGQIIAWTEAIKPPRTAYQFAREAIYVICNSGMKNSVAAPIAADCMRALRQNHSSRTVFGHPGKSTAIDFIWRFRKVLLAEFRQAEDPIAYCATLPWIGPITKYHLAKNLGSDVAKPDVHLLRLAEAEGCTAHELCERLAGETGLRQATVDSILWRACADGIIVPSKAAQTPSANT
jgi:hypothetical protein